MKSDVAARVQHVAKDFHLPRHHSNSLKETITQVFKPKDKGVDVHHALKDISFEVKKGEFFGILGRNGSGKSTLLKIISEIYRPTRGTVEHNGTLVSFIELGVGFKPELSGRENVFLNGALLGFSKTEIEEMYDEIVEFAELEEFMEQKLKNYSSGMKVRLAFSVAIRAKSDILVLDEVLAVGDAAFQRKCYDYFKSLKEDDSKTIIFVTHSMSAVKEYCDRAILVEDGVIASEGIAPEVADEYTMLFDDQNNGGAEKKSVVARLKKAEVRPRCTAEYVYIDIEVDSEVDIIDPLLAVIIKRGNETVYRWVSDENISEKIRIGKASRFLATIKIQNIFPVGMYTLDFSVKNIDRSEMYGDYLNTASFEVANDSRYPHRKLWRPKEGFKIINTRNS